MLLRRLRRRSGESRTKQQRRQSGRNSRGFFPMINDYENAAKEEGKKNPFYDSDVAFQIKFPFSMY